MSNFSIMIKIYFFSESKHCPITSDCRALLVKGSLECHRKILGKFFDQEILDTVDKCVCCYACIHSHAEEGCSSCRDFHETFFPTRSSPRLSKPVSAELRCALKELFTVMAVKEIKVESSLSLGIANFVNDVVKVVDELKTEEDISQRWHVSEEIARKVFSTLNDVLYGEECSDSSGSSEEEEELEEYSEDVIDEEESDSSSDEENECESLELFAIT